MKRWAFGLALASLALCLGFKVIQPGMEQDRVKTAFANAGDRVERLCKHAGLSYPPKRLLIRAFKSERELEVWGSNSGTKPFELIRKYKIAGMSGGLGPKRREGDLQVPEGFYHIDRFNPFSRFHLSLGLNYPNSSDRKLSDKERPGGDIFIHGDNKSIGCLAMTDEKIEEIYILALQAKNGGQTKIPVHIFPFRLNAENLNTAGANSHLSLFWNDLKAVYDHFERAKTVPAITIDSKGRYKLK